MVTEQDFEMYVFQYSDMVYRIAFNYLKVREDAEDVYQNVFLKLYRNAKKYKDEEHVKRWLIRVTLNECHSLWRLPWMQRRSFVEDISKTIERKQIGKMAQQNALNDYEESVRDMLSKIPPKYGMVLYLYYYEEYSTKEIAGILKRKESTISSQMKRGKELLKRKLEERADEEGCLGKKVVLCTKTDGKMETELRRLGRV
ncbi:MAG: RNA polymerase sigma factor [Lachnospiraceae bacterium]|nr:RNA polymerase sigma factor [Lachnospiraceae bacterium]